MKIDLLEINGFGKLKKQSIGLNKGINLVYGKNEAGKSTMQEFIKAMFFSNNSIKESDYVSKYKPWDADVFGGNLHFTLADGKGYRIERNFNNSQFKVYDASLNDLSGLFDIRKERGGVFAKEHLGVDEDFFEKTVFVRQAKSRLSASSKKTLIESAINMFQTGMEDVSVKKVIDELNEILKKHVGNNRTKNKPLDEVEQSIERLEAEEKRLLNERDNVLNSMPKDELKEVNLRLDYENKLIELAKELLEKRTEIDVLVEKRDSLKLYFNSINQQQGFKEQILLKNDEYYDELKNEIEFLNNSLKQKNEQLENLEMKLETHRLFMKNASQYREDIEKLLKNPNSVEKLARNKYLGKANSNKNLKKKILTKIDIVLAIASLGGFYFAFSSLEVNNHAFLSLISAAITYFITNKLKRKTKNTLKPPKEDTNQNLEELLKKIDVQNVSEYYNKINQHDVNILKFERLNDEIEETERRIEKIQSLLEKITQKKDNDENNKQENFDDLNVKQLLQKLEDVEFQIKRKEDSFFEGMDYLNNKCNFEGILSDYEKGLLNKDSRQEDLLKAIELMSKKINETDKTVLLLNKETQNILKDVDEIDGYLKNIAQKRSDLQREKARLEDINESVSIAMEHIKDAGEYIKNKTIPYLSKNFEQITHRVTSGKYDQLNLDENFNIKTIEPALESIVDVALLSGGALEQIYLALRLSIADSITEGKEPLPIILDEVFAYYDDERTLESYKMLKDFYNDKQIVLFTCKSREIEIAQEVFGENMNFVEL